MKKNDRVKTFELFLFMVFAAICFYRIVIISDIYQQVTTNENIMVLCLFLWMSLFLSFAFIFIDFSLYSKQHQSLYDLTNAAKQDTVARIANRYSIDSIIDEYAEKDVPTGMGVSMIELTSLKEVNANFGRIEGNNLIRGFSIILSMASLDECIVGRNGGNRFIILYEDAADLHMEVFLDRLHDKVRDYNANAKNHIMKYEYGTAYAEADNITSITKLIAESSMRLSQKLAAKEENELRKKLMEMNLTPPTDAPVETPAKEPDETAVEEVVGETIEEAASTEEPVEDAAEEIEDIETVEAATDESEEAEAVEVTDEYTETIKDSKVTEDKVIEEPVVAFENEEAVAEKVAENTETPVVETTEETPSPAEYDSEEEYAAELIDEFMSDHVEDATESVNAAISCVEDDYDYRYSDDDLQDSDYKYSDEELSIAG